jgi:pimeloyl-ACP methyl ester carboxylesterase
LKVYFISGLGADARVFRHIRLPSGYEPVHLNWLPPGRKESLRSYALRMSEKIDAQEKFGIVGLSFGGMLAVEIAKLLQPGFIILISSIPCSGHLPPYYRLAGFLKLHRIIPMRLIRTASIFKRNFTKEKSDDKRMLTEMIRDSDPVLIRWALNAIITWKCTDPPGNFIHIHGTHDGILPCRYTRPTHKIHKGTHLMVLTKSREINRVLAEELGGRD